MRIVVFLIICASLLATRARGDGEGVITAIRGEEARTSLGREEGVAVGVTLVVLKSGTPIAHLRVTSASADASAGRFVEPAAEVVTVGDPVRLAPDSRKPVAQAARAEPATSAPPPAQPGRPSGNLVTLVREHMLVVSLNAPDEFPIGALIALTRGGVEVARARVERSGSISAEARVAQYTPGQVAQVGDEAALFAAAAKPAKESPLPRTAVPAREPSQHTVPPTDRAYSLLAQLAASGLVTSAPARVFQQNTVARRRPGDEIVLTRARIAEFIHEAIANRGRDDSLSTSNANALLQLTRDFARDLRNLGVDATGVEQQLASRTRQASVGVSGMAQFRGTRLGATGPELLSEPLAPRSGGSAEARLNVFGNTGSRLSFNTRFEGSSNSPGSHGLVRSATLNYRLGAVEVEGGHREFYEGPGRFGTLLLSDTAGGLDFLGARLRSGDLAYESFAAVIGRDPLRSLHVHRWEYVGAPNFRLGASESVMRFDGRVGAREFIGTAVPLPLLLLGGGFGDNRRNQLISFYAEASSPRGLRFYGEAMMDDLIVKTGETQNHRLGYLLGGQLFNPRAPHRFNAGVEFGVVSPRAYLTFGVAGSETESFFRNGQPLGYFLTPFDDRGQGLNALRFDANVMPWKRLGFGGGWELLDQGTGRAANQRQSNLRVRAVYDLSNSLSLTLRGVKSTTTNAFFGGTTLDRKRVEIEVMKAF